MPTSQAAHPIFSFADAEMGPVSNALIRGIEKISGQPRIRKLYFDYVEEDQPFDNFWSDALDRLNISVDLERDFGAAIPRSGPTLVVANHPYGVIDGLVLCALTAKVRSDYKIITHRVLRQAPATMDKILPIDFDETEAALATNIQTRQDAAAYLRQGGTPVRCGILVQSNSRFFFMMDVLPSPMILTTASTPLPRNGYRRGWRQCLVHKPFSQ